MSVVASQTAVKPARIESEWSRVEVLVQCLLRSRQGKSVDADMLAKLQRLQAEVDQFRAGLNPWRRLATKNLPVLAMDVLACVYASEAQPRVGLLYQELQLGSPQPYITPALIQLLLAVDDSETHSLHELLRPDGELKRRGLVVSDGEGPFSPLKPAKDAVAVLMGWPVSETAPPGSVRAHESATWDDIILPPDRLVMLREFLIWLRYRDVVVGQWGGKKTGGPVGLFCGPSGTGKTYAACVIASELGWPLYRVDLSRLVSKYIGETEKNIGRLLDSAHGREVVLQFDEVDSLMSKRGEVKEARDRYANMEVSYLLARIEEHDGPCILTTNLRSQIDKAFSRRFQIVIEFPRPDFEARCRLWERMLPPQAPREADVDVALLARSVNITGGNIRNAALHAAYLAAAGGQRIGLAQIATGVWRELLKERPQAVKSDLGPLGQYLPSDVL